MTLEARMAIEALRAGVPNRAAIRQMGTEQTGIEHAFEAALCGLLGDAAPARAGPGPPASAWPVASAPASRTCSAIWPRWPASSASWSAASSSARRPRCRIRSMCWPRPCAMRRCRIAPTTRSPPASPRCANSPRHWTRWMPPSACRMPVSHRSSLPACSWCAARPRHPKRFAGSPACGPAPRLSASAIRQALVQSGSGRMFALKAVPAAALTRQLTCFLPLLFRAVGYAGWCVLLDEIELIGRYTPLQRALSYAGSVPGSAWMVSGASPASSPLTRSPMTLRQPSSMPGWIARRRRSG